VAQHVHRQGVNDSKKNKEMRHGKHFIIIHVCGRLSVQFFLRSRAWKEFLAKGFFLLYRSGSSISFPVFAFGESLYDGAGYLRIYGDAILG
jgi:hypothetical protein